MFKNKLVAGLMMSACLSSVHAEAESVWSALKGGTPTVNLRLRYESVDNDATTNVDQDGLILRSAVGYKTGTFKGFSAYVEYENVSSFIEDSYLEDGGILDGEMSDVNHAYLQYKQGMVTGILGRQTVIYDNARHIGNVGWRQNDQTFDAATIKLAPTDKLSLSYNYIWQVNRIHTFPEEESDHHLFNASYKMNSYANFTGYYYKLDFEADGIGLYSTDATDLDTFGLRFTGSAPMGDSAKFLYTAEYADQSDGSDNAASIDTSYLLAEVGVALPMITAKIGYEVLESDGGTAGFATPLATVHAHNGWSDWSTPLTTGSLTNGIEDTYLNLSGSIGKVKLAGFYHILDANEGATDYGDEIDIVATYKTEVGPVLGAKAALFDADGANGGNDINKFWIWAQYKI